MISVTSVTDKYILQPSLMGKHRQTLEWMSTAMFWKRELSFFQKLLDKYAPKFHETEDKKKIDYFQNFIVYYNGELVDTLISKLRNHEKNLASMLQKKDESNTKYLSDHDGLMGELEATHIQFGQYKQDLFDLIEGVL